MEYSDDQQLTFAFLGFTIAVGSGGSVLIAVLVSRVWT
jgi:hypothetical protein